MQELKKILEEIEVHKKIAYAMYDVIAWQPLPESYRPERSDNHDGE